MHVESVKEKKNLNEIAKLQQQQKWFIFLKGQTS